MTPDVVMEIAPTALPITDIAMADGTTAMGINIVASVAEMAVEPEPLTGTNRNRYLTPKLLYSNVKHL